MTPNRKYQSGRPTQGWAKGEKITDLSQLTVGGTLIVVSHQFRAENLIRVLAISETPSRGFRSTYIGVNGEPTGEREMFTWDWDLNSDFYEHYKAVKVA